MNLFLEYQKKIFDSFKKMEKKKLIKIPKNLEGITVELPPANLKADISCNAAMILFKVNNCPAIELAEILKKNLLENFKEFKSIDIARPGFMNICFNISFWEKCLKKIVGLNLEYGANKFSKNVTDGTYTLHLGYFSFNNRGIADMIPQSPNP